MEQWKKDGGKNVVLVDLEAFVPADHLLWKLKKSWTTTGLPLSKTEHSSGTITE